MSTTVQVLNTISIHSVRSFMWGTEGLISSALFTSMHPISGVIYGLSLGVFHTATDHYVKKLKKIEGLHSDAKVLISGLGLFSSLGLSVITCHFLGVVFPSSNVERVVLVISTFIAGLSLECCLSIE